MRAAELKFMSRYLDILSYLLSRLHHADGCAWWNAGASPCDCGHEKAENEFEKANKYIESKMK